MRHQQNKKQTDFLDFSHQNKHWKNFHTDTTPGISFFGRKKWNVTKVRIWKIPKVSVAKKEY